MARSYPTWTSSSVELNRKLRALWEQHVYWTRLTVNSIVDGLPDVNATTERLLRNPDDFAEVLASVYGIAIANEFARLLREHLTIAAELVGDLKSGNSEAAADAQRRWYANADSIADFLGRINPYWSQMEWQHMMYEHLGLLSDEVSTRIAKDYVKNVALNDQIETQALGMADMMTSGIVQQFPSNFLS
ncbi:acetylglutamate kinase [Paenibacillus sp. Sa2BVA9]|uniref:Acetylglutamate kinase n=1 Tax=Paenibacillus gallinarum TaxID=2762232 RepID=A0ABR8SV65_9BACL|nr:acetylglutamate kinase [Paenibacillus gallinarum]